MVCARSLFIFRSLIAFSVVFSGIALRIGMNLASEKGSEVQVVFPSMLGRDNRYG
jgi:hypothetical protein